MKNVFIYALKDPDTSEVRYVGKAENPFKRFQQHLLCKDNTHRSKWLQSVRQRGFPILEIVAEVPENEWPMWEVAYIQFFREIGCDLVNANDGGMGGFNPSLETRRVISKKSTLWQTGRKLGLRHVENIILSHARPHLGKHLSLEAKLALRLVNLGKIKGLETREKIRKAMVGKKRSDETRMKMRLARLSFWERKKTSCPA